MYSFAPPNVVHLITILEVRLSVRRESRAVRTDDRSNSFPFNDKPLQSNAAHARGMLDKINAVLVDRILMKGGRLRVRGCLVLIESICNLQFASIIS